MGIVESATPIAQGLPLRDVTGIPVNPAGGRPLQGALRGELEEHFGTDLGRVRIHSGAEAAQSARAVGARAYTVGRHIVFGADRYQPGTAGGRALVAHEVTHTIQQGMAEPAPGGWTRVLAAGHTAECEAALSGPVVSERVAPAIARQPEAAAHESAGSSAGDSLIERAAIAAAGAMRGHLPIPVPETMLAALIAAEGAFIERGFRRLITGGELWSIAGRIRELASSRVAVEFAGRYLWGVAKGLVSPITGLIQFAVAAVELAGSAGSGILQRLGHLPELETEAAALATEFGNFTTVARTNLKSFQSQKGALEFASAVFVAAQTLGTEIEQQMVSAAAKKGREAADSLVDELRKSPLPDLAETAGEIIGTVVIEIVLLLFSDGIGNLIAKLGEFVSELRPLSRGVGYLADVLRGAGRVITELEHIVGKLMTKTVLRPLMPLLEALEPLLGRLRRFARSALGLSEEAASRAVTRELHPPVAPPAVPGRGSRSPRRPVRGATAEGTGQDFHYEYHPEQPSPHVEKAPPRRSGGGASKAAEPSRPASRKGGGLELDEQTRRTLAGRSTADAPGHTLEPEEAAGLGERHGGDRFHWSMSEEDLALFAQEHFPEYGYDPAKRGRRVFRSGEEVRGRPARSTVPDLYLEAEGRPPISLESKNVLVTDPVQREEFVVSTVVQAQRRAAALPPGALQHMVIDLRGQDVTRELAASLRRELAARSGGILGPGRIHFIPPSLD